MLQLNGEYVAFFVANKNTDYTVQNFMSTKTLIVQSVPKVMSNCCELNRFECPTVLWPIQISQVIGYKFCQPQQNISGNLNL